MPPIDPQSPPPSLGDFSAKPRPADLPAAVPSHDYELRHCARTRRLQIPDDFIELQNPTDRTLSARLYLGPPPGSGPFTPSSSDDDDEPTAKQRAAAWAYQCTLFTRIVFAPGEVLAVPRALVEALVTVRDGQVVGGHIPQLVLPGDPHPPTLHPSLVTESDDQPFAVPVAGRSTTARAARK